MTVTVTLNLPSNLVEHAQYFGQATQRDIDEVLVDTLEMMWPTLGGDPDATMYPPISSMSDADVVSLADKTMDLTQYNRLTELQTKGKSYGLTADERYELLALMHIYQLGQLRKAQGLEEAVHRGLKQLPLS